MCWICLFGVTKAITKVVKVTKTTWSNLKGENYGLVKDKLLEIGNWPIEEETNVMWNEMSSIIQRVAKEILDEPKMCGLLSKKSWWWSGEVQKAVKGERKHLKTWQKVKK